MPYLKCKTENGYNWVFGIGKDWIRGVVETVLEGCPKEMVEKYESYIRRKIEDDLEPPRIAEDVKIVVEGCYYYFRFRETEKDAILIVLDTLFDNPHRFFYKFPFRSFKSVVEERISKKIIDTIVHETLHKCINDIVKIVKGEREGREEIVEELTSYSLE